MSRYVDESRRATRLIAEQLLGPVGRTARTLSRRIADRVRTEGLVDSGDYAASWKPSSAVVSRNRRKVTAIVSSELRVPMEGRQNAIPLVFMAEWGASREGAGGVQPPTPHIRPEVEAIASEFRRNLSGAF